MIKTRCSGLLLTLSACGVTFGADTDGHPPTELVRRLQSNDEDKQKTFQEP